MTMSAAVLGNVPSMAACQLLLSSEEGSLENLVGVRSCVSLYQQMLPAGPPLSNISKEQSPWGVVESIVQRTSSTGK